MSTEPEKILGILEPEELKNFDKTTSQRLISLDLIRKRTSRKLGALRRGQILLLFCLLVSVGLDLSMFIGFAIMFFVCVLFVQINYYSKVYRAVNDEVIFLVSSSTEKVLTEL